MIRQALYPDPSCRATLAWLQTARVNEGLPTLSHDTSGYCKARHRLPAGLLPRLARRVAENLTAQADTEQLWHGRRVLAADGSAFSMPDTPGNQERFPQSGVQKKGCGFPVGVFVAVACLATGAIVDAFIGGGKMHDLAMFYYVRSCFVAGDIFLADRGFSAYSEMALFLGKGVDSVLRLHQKRLTDFKNGRILGIDDHIVCWPRPKFCPKGLRAEDYEKQMDVLRGRSPDVVEKEFWAHILAYNLLRRLMWEGGVIHGVPPVSLSVKGSIQHLLSRWMLFWHRRLFESLGELLLAIALEEVPYRPGRVEPRVRKRRPKNYSLMTKPRNELKKMLPMKHY